MSFIINGTNYRHVSSGRYVLGFRTGRQIRTPLEFDTIFILFYFFKERVSRF